MDGEMMLENGDERRRCCKRLNFIQMGTPLKCEKLAEVKLLLSGADKHMIRGPDGSRLIY